MIQTTARPLLVLCALLAAGATPVLYACGGHAKPADTATEPAESASGAEPAASTPSALTAPAEAASAQAAPDTSPLAQVLTTDSGEIQKFFEAASAAPAATLKENGAKGGDPLAKGIRDAGKKLPPGMQPDGPLA